MMILLPKIIIFTVLLKDIYWIFYQFLASTIEIQWWSRYRLCFWNELIIWYGMEKRRMECWEHPWRWLFTLPWEFTYCCSKEITSKLNLERWERNKLIPLRSLRFQTLILFPRCLNMEMKEINKIVLLHPISSP